MYCLEPRGNLGIGGIHRDNATSIAVCGVSMAPREWLMILTIFAVLTVLGLIQNFASPGKVFCGV